MLLEAGVKIALKYSFQLLGMMTRKLFCDTMNRKIMGYIIKNALRKSKMFSANQS